MQPLNNLKFENKENLLKNSQEEKSTNSILTTEKEKIRFDECLTKISFYIPSIPDFNLSYFLLSLEKSSSFLSSSKPYLKGISVFSFLERFGYLKDVVHQILEISSPSSPCFSSFPITFNFPKKQDPEVLLKKVWEKDYKKIREEFLQEKTTEKGFVWQFGKEKEKIDVELYPKEEIFTIDTLMISDWDLFSKSLPLKDIFDDLIKKNIRFLPNIQPKEEHLSHFFSLRTLSGFQVLDKNTLHDIQNISLKKFTLSLDGIENSDLLFLISLNASFFFKTDRFSLPEPTSTSFQQLRQCFIYFPEETRRFFPLILLLQKDTITNNEGLLQTKLEDIGFVSLEEKIPDLSFLNSLTSDHWKAFSFLSSFCFSSSFTTFSSEKISFFKEIADNLKNNKNKEAFSLGAIVSFFIYQTTKKETDLLFCFSFLKKSKFPSDLFSCFLTLLEKEVEKHLTFSHLSSFLKEEKLEDFFISCFSDPKEGLSSLGFEMVKGNASILEKVVTSSLEKAVLLWLSLSSLDLYDHLFRLKEAFLKKTETPSLPATQKVLKKIHATLPKNLTSKEDLYWWIEKGIEKELIVEIKPLLKHSSLSEEEKKELQEKYPLLLTEEEKFEQVKDWMRLGKVPDHILKDHFLFSSYVQASKDHLRENLFFTLQKDEIVFPEDFSKLTEVSDKVFFLFVEKIFSHKKEDFFIQKMKELAEKDVEKFESLFYLIFSSSIPNKKEIFFKLLPFLQFKKKASKFFGTIKNLFSSNGEQIEVPAIFWEKVVTGKLFSQKKREDWQEILDYSGWKNADQALKKCLEKFLKEENEEKIEEISLFFLKLNVHLENKDIFCKWFIKNKKPEKLMRFIENGLLFFQDLPENFFSSCDTKKEKIKEMVFSFLSKKSTFSKAEKQFLDSIRKEEFLFFSDWPFIKNYFQDLYSQDHESFYLWIKEELKKERSSQIQLLSSLLAFFENRSLIFEKFQGFVSLALLEMIENTNKDFHYTLEWIEFCQDKEKIEMLFKACFNQINKKKASETIFINFIQTFSHGGIFPFWYIENGFYAFSKEGKLSLLEWIIPDWKQRIEIDNENVLKEIFFCLNNHFEKEIFIAIIRCFEEGGIFYSLPFKATMIRLFRNIWVEKESKEANSFFSKEEKVLFSNLYFSCCGDDPFEKVREFFSCLFKGGIKQKEDFSMEFLSSTCVLITNMFNQNDSIEDIKNDLLSTVSLFLKLIHQEKEFPFFNQVRSLLFLLDSIKTVPKKALENEIYVNAFQKFLFEIPQKILLSEKVTPYLKTTDFLLPFLNHPSSFGLALSFYFFPIFQNREALPKFSDDQVKFALSLWQDYVYRMQQLGKNLGEKNVSYELPLRPFSFFLKENETPFYDLSLEFLQTFKEKHANNTFLLNILFEMFKTITENELFSKETRQDLLMNAIYRFYDIIQKNPSSFLKQSLAEKAYQILGFMIQKELISDLGSFLTYFLIIFKKYVYDILLDDNFEIASFYMVLDYLIMDIQKLKKSFPHEQNLIENLLFVFFKIVFDPDTYAIGWPKESIEKFQKFHAMNVYDLITQKLQKFNSTQNWDMSENIANKIEKFIHELNQKRIKKLESKKK